jgi:hypothetical protein
MWSKLWKVVSGPLYIVGTLASVASILVLCFNNSSAAILALVFLCLALTLFLWKIFRVLNRFLEKTTEDHRHISSFIQYVCDDGDNITVESYKLIQIKCSMMHEYRAGFKWSGTNIPKISSDLQNFKIIKQSQDEHLHDNAVLEFKKPVLYNETTVVHSKYEINDVDHKSAPYVEIPINYPVEYIQICVALGYKESSFNKTAVLRRRKLTNANEIQQEYKPFDSLPFDAQHKQYTFRLINPKVGYTYRIEWER